MGKLFLIKLEGKVYSCKYCETHLAISDDIISKSFYCSHGKAYLFNNVSNVTVEIKEEQMTIVGTHIISDVFCVGCGASVGWKYEPAPEMSQEGKIILARYSLIGPDGSRYWLNRDSDMDGSDSDDDDF